MICTDKITMLVGDVCVGASGLGNSLLSPQFHYGPKTALQNEVC